MKIIRRDYSKKNDWFPIACLLIYRPKLVMFISSRRPTMTSPTTMIGYRSMSRRTTLSYDRLSFDVTHLLHCLTSDHPPRRGHKTPSYRTTPQIAALRRAPSCVVVGHPRPLTALLHHPATAAYRWASMDEDLWILMIDHPRRRRLTLDNRLTIEMLVFYELCGFVWWYDGM